MHRFIVPALLQVSTVAAPTPAWAVQSSLENLDALDARVAVFLGGTPAEAGQRAQPVDRRLRMAQCPEGVAFDPPSMGALTAYCASKGWRLRVPLIGAVAAQPTEIVIRRGDSVELAFLGASFDVVTTATALEDGHVGGMVRVKTPTGTSAVTARVRGPNSVAIGD